jgi:hypothetical protein
MSKAIEDALTYLNTKVDDFEGKYFAAKKEEDRSFFRESLLFYRFEAAKVRSQLLDLDELMQQAPSKNSLKFANEAMLPEGMHEHVEAESVNP